MRTADIGTCFGAPHAPRRVTVIEPTEIPLRPGEIVLIHGPSGSGKSSALAAIGRRCAGGCDVGRVSFPPDVAIVDRIAPSAPLPDALSLMTCCGLGEVDLWLRPFETLSDGEKFRARLARAVALHSRAAQAPPLLCDEFCANLHRRAAQAISFNLRKLVARRGLCIVLACAQEDVIPDLGPHVLARLRGRGKCEVQDRAAGFSPRGAANTWGPDRPKTAARSTLSLLRRLCIKTGAKTDYDAFAAMHYRATDELGFVDKVFVLREGVAGETLGVVVYAHSPLELSLRNQATDGWFKRRPRRVNRCLRILRRLVIHPDVRGCGLGHFLVRKTLPLLGTEFVECLAGMGEFNPVFEKAGMQRIGQYEVSPQRQAAAAALFRMGVGEPSAESSPKLCGRGTRERQAAAKPA
jgi:ABC-type ATPase with predicted acetyltransferase domain